MDNKLEYKGSSERIEGQRCQRPFVELPESCEELRKDEYELFSLAPLYSYVGFESPIHEKFAADSAAQGIAVQHTSIEFGHPLVGMCGRNGCVLEVMAKKNYKAFCPWLGSQVFLNRAKGSLYLPRIYTVKICDPFMYAKNKYVETFVTLWCISGNRGQLLPKPVTETATVKPLAQKPFVELEAHLAPDQEAVRLYESVMQVPS